jgi:predicted nuclease with TOPRIM domain
MNSPALLLTDGRDALKQDLKQLKKEMEVILQVYYRLENEYKGKKKRFEKIDREWALRDGRLHIVKEAPKQVETKLEKDLKAMSQEEIEEFIKDLKNLVK